MGGALGLGAFASKSVWTIPLALSWKEWGSKDDEFMEAHPPYLLPERLHPSGLLAYASWGDPLQTSC